ncbi:phage portal protein [Clostridium sp. D2Q-14]|uniref:phage portal protein n=1 Tax=Anaeromonas gelatinilytica TaxID=2683194 RepID=UPI00193C377E|nr:phage portal protein [Anaeromonas gelatinilytica]MBS4535823.1 phage portal protein [Anaeromonas gelatinilytica]
MFNLFNNKINVMSTEEILYNEIQEFNSSDQKSWMVTGEKYYKVYNDINERVITRLTDSGAIEDKSKANNKLAHGFMKNLIDEKIGYLLAKDYTLDCKNKNYVEKLKDTLGKYFQYTLTRLGYEASNKGIAWLQVYIDEQGNFGTMLIPAEQCVPLWRDNTHTELDGMLRFYIQTVYEGREKKKITKVEYHTENEIYYYVVNSDRLIPDIEQFEGGPILHYKKGEEGRSWGKVPFIPFKNNFIEYPDVRFIKSLIDSYDKSRSEIDNFIEETKNLIYILKGYGGEDIADFMKDLNYYRAIKIDDPEHGGVDTLNPTIDIAAAKEHFEQLKRDINEFGQGVPTDQDKFGNNPSGISLKFLYAGLDLKCNHLEREFRRAFEQLLYFINVYLAENGQGNFNEDVKIIFNRDIQINESEAIDNAVKSKTIISDETIVANHPWVGDLEEELKKLEKQAQRYKEEAGLKYDKVPVKDGEGNE